MECACPPSLVREKLRPEAELQRQIDLLSISTRFDFDRVREASIKCIRYGLSRRQEWFKPVGESQWLAGISPIDRICLAEKYDIPEWLRPSYEDLCQRVAPLEVHEAERIGVRTATLLARAREAVREKHLLRGESRRISRSNTPPLSHFDLQPLSHPIHLPPSHSSSPPLSHSNLPLNSNRLYDEQMVSRVVQEVFDCQKKGGKANTDFSQI